jgi:hypothetical protein
MGDGLLKLMRSLLAVEAVLFLLTAAGGGAIRGSLGALVLKEPGRGRDLNSNLFSLSLWDSRRMTPVIAVNFIKIYISFRLLT